MKKTKHFFDLTIFKYALLAPLKRFDFYLVFLLTLITTSVIFFLSELFGMGTILVVQTFMIITINSMLLSCTFINDRDTDVINMELRKGRNTKQAYFSRWMANKVYSFALNIIPWFIFVMKLVATQSTLLNNYIYIIFLVLTFDVLYSSIFLLVFSLGFKRAVGIAVGIAYVGSTFMYTTPFFKGVYSATQRTLLAKNNIYQSLVSDKTLELYTVENSLMQQLFLNAKLYNELEDDQSQVGFAVKSFTAGILLEADVKELLSNLVVNGTEKTINYKPEARDLMLYKLNEIVIADKSLSMDYSKSIYTRANAKSSERNFSLAELKKVITIINKQYQATYAGVTELNDFILDFVQAEIFTSGFSQEMNYDLTYNSNSDLSIINQNLEKLTLQTPVGLKIWNETIAKMLYQANQAQKIEVGSQKDVWAIRSVNYFAPFFMAYESSMYMNQYLKPIYLFGPQQSNALQAVFYYKGNKYFNTTRATSPFGEVVVGETSNKKVYGQVFNVIVYTIFLLSVGLGLTWYGSRRFEKTTRR